MYIDPFFGLIDLKNVEGGTYLSSDHIGIPSGSGTMRGIGKSTYPFIVVVVLAIFLLGVVPQAGAEKTTRNYTVPNGTPYYGPGKVNDSFDLKASDEVTISWEADLRITNFFIACSEFTGTAVSFGSNWNKTYSIEYDCTVFVEWWNSKDVPIQIELTIETHEPSIFDDPFSSIPLMIVLSISTLIIIVAIGLSLKRRSGRTTSENDEAIDVVSTGIPETRDTRGSGSGVELTNRCKRCGMNNPSDAEFCQGCNKPTDLFRRDRG